eukprot:TRINITY_DN1661_c0_g2_i1.p1 TRINITY_DN1661_c0_g2~~TRINITY_DN1661_c0_g2_i1.p1  ORF type:complete len:788 (+),score=164.69 TRINITY_DN1661_c0_g2_i1:77-2365(+)
MVSTVASLAGGLVMYFQSLASLDETLREVSRSEVGSVKDKLNGTLTQLGVRTEQQKSFMYNLERLPPNATAESWRNLSRTYQFAAVNSTFSLCYMLYPWDMESTTEWEYVCMWANPLISGGRELEWAATHSDSFTPASAKNPATFMVDTFRMNRSSGSIVDYAYTWDGIAYTTYPKPGWDPVAEGVPDVEGWEAGPGTAVAHGYRDPGSWWTSDGAVYSYFGIDAVYAPPPPPHPWSRYRAVLGVAQLLLGEWVEYLQQYGRDHEDTTLVLVDAVGQSVWASTTAHTLVDQACAREFSIGDICATKVKNMSQTVQDAFAALVLEPPGTFRRESLDGEEHFVRKEDLQLKNLVLLWMRPTSTVQGKVNEALVLLVVFSLCVLLFDVAISVFEMVYIGQPMRHLSTAIEAIGNMETEAATAALVRYDSKLLTLKEVSRLIRGMQTTVGRLEEFRAYMPASVLLGAEESSDTLSECASQTSENSALTQSQASYGSDDAGRKMLKLHVASRNVGLLVVNVVDWWGKASRSDLLSQYGAMASAILQCCVTAGGVLDSFSGDRFFVGWNCAKGCADYSAATATTALQVSEVLKASGHVASCGVTTGAAKVGNMGTASVRRFSVMSPLVPWVMQLEFYNKIRGLTCTTDGRTVSRLGIGFVYCVTDALVCHKRQGIFTVVDLRERVAMDEDEWMYQVDSAATAGTEAVNTLALAIISSDWDRVPGGPLPQGMPEWLLESSAKKKYCPLQNHFKPCEDPVVRATYTLHKL